MATAYRILPRRKPHSRTQWLTGHCGSCWRPTLWRRRRSGFAMLALYRSGLRPWYQASWTGAAKRRHRLAVGALNQRRLSRQQTGPSAEGNAATEPADSAGSLLTIRSLSSDNFVALDLEDDGWITLGRPADLLAI